MVDSGVALIHQIVDASKNLLSISLNLFLLSLIRYRSRNEGIFHNYLRLTALGVRILLGLSVVELVVQPVCSG